MVRKITLHGGPLHGEELTIPDDRDHIHIGTPVTGEEAGEDDEVKARTGMYSQVANSPKDFEWDGWVSHE